MSEGTNESPESESSGSLPRPGGPRLSVRALVRRSRHTLDEMFHSLRVAAFRQLWTSTLISMAAVQMSMVARPWLAYDLTRSAVTLGLVAGARSVPQLLLTPLGGAVADRVPKRTLLIMTQAALATLTMVDAVLLHLGIIQIWHLVLTGLCQGAVIAFNMPARQAFVPELVPAGVLPNAIVANSTAMNVNKVLAPAVGGLLLAWSPMLAFYASAGLFLSASLMISRLPRRAAARQHTRSALADVGEGFHYVWTDPALRTLLLLAFIPTLLGMPFQQLLPVFQADVFRVGPSELGTMYATVGAGALTSSLIMTFLSGSRRQGTLLGVAGIGFGLVLFLLAVTPTYLLALPVLFVVGGFSQGFMTLNQIMLMLRTDRAHYGRVASMRMITWSLMPASLLVLGIFVDRWGVSATVAVQGLLLAAFVSLVAARRGLRNGGAAAPEIRGRQESGTHMAKNSTTGV